MKRFTIIEVLAVIAILAQIALAGVVIWVAAHFISKYW
jgi:prepilin-type N-terminal cleavage/methylation domain-containing protein